jgi:putative phosphoribosyl transferase
VSARLKEGQIDLAQRGEPRDSRICLWRQIIPDRVRLFEEPGILETVVGYASSGSPIISGGRDVKFEDRSDAGRRLAARMTHLKNAQPVIMALPRGGVAVGCEIARALDAPLDIVLVRKIGVPWQLELALGAVTDGASPEIFIDRELATSLAVPESYVEEETARQLEEIERRRKSYCEGRPSVEVAGRTAIVVDDGIATGATMRVALQAVRRRGPARLILAVPVAPPDTLAALSEEADETVCLETPIGLGAIGFYYRDFHQMKDAEVTNLLAHAQQPTKSSAGSRDS